MNTLGTIAILGACAGTGYAVGRAIGKTEEEKQRYGEAGLLIGAGIGAIGLIALHYHNRSRSNTVNYTLHHRKKIVYEGICYKDRLDTRMKEHTRSGKLFNEVTIDKPKPRHMALNLERERIQRIRPKYNIHHNRAV